MNDENGTLTNVVLHTVFAGKLLLLLFFIFISLVTKEKRKTIWDFFTNPCDIRHVFKMYLKSIHEYRAFKKVFEYNTNTCIHNF